jgi:hypothetical protein
MVNHLHAERFPASEGKSEVEIPAAKVATLSRHVFQAPSGNSGLADALSDTDVSGGSLSPSRTELPVTSVGGFPFVPILCSHSACLSLSYSPQPPPFLFNFDLPPTYSPFSSDLLLSTSTTGPP